MDLKKIIYIIILLTITQTVYAQPFTKQDSLRGSITAERIWWDLVYYHLDIEILPEKKEIVGSNTIFYKVLETNQLCKLTCSLPSELQKLYKKV